MADETVDTGSETAETEEARDERIVAKIKDAMSEDEDEGYASLPSDDSDDSDDLLDRATKAGMTDEEVQSFEDPDALAKAISLLEARATKSDGSASKSPADEYEDPLADIDDTFLDEAAVEALHSLRDYFNTKIGLLQSENAQLREAVEQQQTAAASRRFDKALEDLGKAYGSLFGEGDTGDLDRKSKEFRNRMAVRDEMETIAIGLESRGRPVPEEDVLFQKALRSVFGTEIEKIEKDRQRRKISARNRQIISRPTQRKTAELVGEEQVIDKLASAMRDMGIEPY